MLLSFSFLHLPQREILTLRKRYLAIIQKACRSRDIGFMQLDGTLSVNQRKVILQSFREEGTVRVLLLSMKAAGLGLNITVANHVILMGTHIFSFPLPFPPPLSLCFIINECIFVINQIFGGICQRKLKWLTGCTESVKRRQFTALASPSKYFFLVAFISFYEIKLIFDASGYY